MKKLFWVVLVAFGVSLAPVVWAECPMSGKSCSKSSACPTHGGGKSCSKSHGGDSHQCPVTEKLMKKSHFFLENKEELGLLDDQVKTISDIKLQVKKTTIRQEAEMKIFMLNIQAKLGEEKLDVEGINLLIDEGMAGMSQGTKANVALYAKLKSVLTADQMVKAKEIWKKKN